MWYLITFLVTYLLQKLWKILLDILVDLPVLNATTKENARIGEGHFESKGRRRSPLEGMFFLVFSSVSYQFQLIKTKITTRNKHNNLICSDVVGLNMIDDFLIDGINLIHRVTWRYLRYLTGDRDRMTRKRKRNPLFIPTTLVSSHLF